MSPSEKPSVEAGAVTAEAFATAIAKVSMTAKRVELVRAHYMSPGRTATAGQLADARGWKSFDATNLHYERLAFDIAQRLDFRLASASVRR